MKDVKEERILRRVASTLGPLTFSAREAESLKDQALADAIWDLSFRVEAVLRAAEQPSSYPREWISPSQTSIPTVRN
jgi:hypothetical protein